MTRGEAIPVEIRRVIFDWFDEGLTAKSVYCRMKNGRLKGLLSESRALALECMYRNKDTNRMEHYLARCYKSFSGRFLVLTPSQDEDIERLNNLDPDCDMEELRREVAENVGVAVSDRGLKRALKRRGVNRKQYTVVPGEATDAEQLDHLEAMKYYPAGMLLNFDQTHEEGENKSHSKRGRGGKGRLTRKQWSVGGVRFTVMAVVGPKGFVCWKLYFKNCSEAQVLDFVNTELKDVVVPGQLLLYDNASINRTAAVNAAVTQAMGGLWKRVSKYSHWLSPIERSFNMAWSYVRKHRRVSSLNHVSAADQIQAALTYYSVAGPGGKKMKNLFKVYERNHEIYQDEMKDRLRYA